MANTRVRYRIGKNINSGTVDITVNLMQGATQIATWTHSGVAQGFATFEQNLSDVQEGTITDTTDLRLQFVPTIS